MRRSTIKHEFVEFIPNTLTDGVLYVSIPHATATHRCCCGCGNEVITPLGPTDWEVTYNGATVSLNPSIGNWNFPCQSHYWIKHDEVRWARQWSKREIEIGREYDRSAKHEYFDESDGETEAQQGQNQGASIWKKILRPWF